jgi:nucleoside-diphosphate-sugar epimerase
VGVLGCGYVGQQLLTTKSWAATSWYTVHQHDAQLNYNAVAFVLDQPATWPSLPEHADCLIFTIPPTSQDRALERASLVAWGEWMKVNRPQLKRLIYFSTTGVYAETPAHYTEQSPAEPSLNRGFLRLDSEQLLAQYFDVVSLRCGGIYGSGNNMVEKILAKQPLFAGNKLMYRIHVGDLVGVIATLVNKISDGQFDFTQPYFNLVDDEAICQDEIIDWLLSQPQLSKERIGTVNIRDKRLDADTTAPARTVCNKALSEQLGYQLLYPGYQSGLGEIINSLCLPTQPQ